VSGYLLSIRYNLLARRGIVHELDRIDPQRDIRIILIEGAEHILAACSKEIGVEIRTSARVTEVTAEGLRLSELRHRLRH
jgi:NADH:quinone reductase (non-electrogenic)